MPSFRAYLTSWMVWGYYYRRKHATEQELLLSVRDNWKGKFAEEVVPPYISSATETIAVSEEKFKGDGKGGQEWKVFHCAVPSGRGEVGAADKVVIYWHGGAFIHAAASQHWGAVHRIVRDHRIPVVFPHYTRVPLSTADDWCRNALQFVLGLASDPRYAGKKIVHMGDSAGGWMSLRFRMLLCGILLREEELSGMKIGEDTRRRVKELLDGMGSTIMISPVVNLEMSDALEEKDALDPWLSIAIFRIMRRIWIRGPSCCPEIDFDLPAERPAIASQSDSTDALYSDGRYSLNNGLDVFKRYHDVNPSTPPFHLLTMIGTYDLCHVGCEDMQARLEKLGSKVVKADYIEAEGCVHVYPILTMPEAETAWVKIGELLRE